MRGGSYRFTLPLMHHPRYRNYFAAGRSDVFAGFPDVLRSERLHQCPGIGFSAFVKIPVRSGLCGKRLIVDFWPFFV